MRAILPVFASLGLVAASMGPACDSCFVRGTRVSTEDGERPIEDLVVGDLVLAFCPREARVVARRVVALHRALVREVRTLTLEVTGDEPGPVVRASPSHPFWVVEKGAYVPLRDVREGDRLLVRTAGALHPVSVRSIRGEETPDPSFEVFNLSVEEPASSYFAAGILVHNKEPVPRSCGDEALTVGPVLKIADEGDLSARHRFDVTFARQAQLRVSGYGQRDESASSQFELEEVSAAGSEDGLRWTVEVVSEKDAVAKVSLTGESRREDGSACAFSEAVDVR